MPEVQKPTHHPTGESPASIHDSLFLNIVKKKGFEVLMLIDPIDKYAVTQLEEFDGKKMVYVSKVGPELEETEDEKKTREDESKCKAIKDTLSDRVVASSRITDSSRVLVAQSASSPNMEQAPALQDLSMVSKKTLELNPNNTIKELEKKVAEDKVNKSVNAPAASAPPSLRSPATGVTET